jgi:hypothetical protein
LSASQESVVHDFPSSQDWLPPPPAHEPPAHVCPGIQVSPLHEPAAHPLPSGAGLQAAVLAEGEHTLQGSSVLELPSTMQLPSMRQDPSWSTLLHPRIGSQVSIVQDT